MASQENTKKLQTQTYELQSTRALRVCGRGRVFFFGAVPGALWSCRELKRPGSKQAHFFQRSPLSQGGTPRGPYVGCRLRLS